MIENGESRGKDFVSGSRSVRSLTDDLADRVFRQVVNVEDPDSSLFGEDPKMLPIRLRGVDRIVAEIVEPNCKYL